MRITPSTYIAGLWAAVLCACPGAPADSDGGSSAAGLTETSTSGPPPTSTTEPSESSLDTDPGSETAPPTVCGDGVVDADEACDDGNALQGDGCNNDCTPSGALLWAYRGDLALNNAFHALAVMPDASIIAGGDRFRDGGQDRWLVHFTTDGVIAWSRAYEAETFATALGVAVSGPQIFGAGANRGDTRKLWVGSFDHDGEPGWSDIVESPFGPAYATGIAATPDGDIVVTGLSTLEDGNAELWTRRYGPDGAVRWTETRAIQDKALFSQGPGISAGEKYILVGFYSNPGPVELLLGYPPGGGPPALDVPLTGMGPFYATAQAPGGDLLAAGWAKSLGSTVRRFSGDGAHLWSVIDPMGNVGRALAIDSQGDVVMVGDALGATKLDIAVYKFSAEGKLRWSRLIDGGAGEDLGRAVAILPDDRIAVAGHMWRAGSNDQDAWLGVYSP